MNSIKTITPENWTDTDRKTINTLRKLDNEQMEFLLAIMDYATKSDENKQFIENNVNNYHVNTIEGRTAFLAFLKDSL